MKLFYKGQNIFVTIHPLSKQGAECRQYFETKGILNEMLDRDIYNVYIRKAVVEKVGQKFYTVRYQYSPDGGYWISGIKFNKEEPFYEKDKHYCCLSETYEEASNKLSSNFCEGGDYNV